MSRMRGCLIVFGVLAFISSPLAQQNTITDAPEVSDPFTLTAQYDPEARRRAPERLFVQWVRGHQGGVGRDDDPGRSRRARGREQDRRPTP